jgi:hypothetical protein
MIAQTVASHVIVNKCRGDLQHERSGENRRQRAIVGETSPVGFFGQTYRIWQLQVERHHVS